MTDWPQSSAQVLDLITKAERSRKFFWTAGRVLKEAALWTRLGELNYDERKRVRRLVTKYLEELAASGILQRRGLRQSVRLDNEVGFDYIHTSPKKNQTISCPPK